MYNHKRYALRPASATQSYLYRKLSELLSTGKSFEPRKVFETDDEREALQEEQRRIAVYGLDTLLNCSPAHAGTLQEHIHEARRQAMSKARREYVNKLQRTTGHKMPLEVRAKIVVALKDRILPPNFGQKISAAKKGVALTTEHKVALTGVPKLFKNEEVKRQRDLSAGAAIKRAWDEGHMTGSRGQRVLFKNPEERVRKISVANKGKTVSQVTRDKIAVTLRGRSPVFSDPECRLRKISESLKKAWLEGRCKPNTISIEAMRKANTGKSRSVETRKLLSEKRRQRPVPTFTVTSPDGASFNLDSYALSAYCSQHGIHRTNLLRPHGTKGHRATIFAKAEG